MTFSCSAHSSDWYIGYRQARTEIGHCTGGGVRKTVRQQVEELSEMPGPHSPEARSKVVDSMSRHPRCEYIKNSVADAPERSRVGIGRPSSNYHVIPLTQFLKQTGNISWIMLTIGVHENQHITRCVSSPCFDSRAVPHAVRVRDYLDAVLTCDVCRFVLGTVIHKHNLGPRELIP